MNIIVYHLKVRILYEVSMLDFEKKSSGPLLRHLLYAWDACSFRLKPPTEVEWRDGPPLRARGTWCIRGAPDHC